MSSQELIFSIFNLSIFNLLNFEFLQLIFITYMFMRCIIIIGLCVWERERHTHTDRGGERERKHAHDYVHACHGTCVKFRWNFVKSFISFDLLMCPWGQTQFTMLAWQLPSPTDWSCQPSHSYILKNQVLQAFNKKWRLPTSLIWTVPSPEVQWQKYITCSASVHTSHYPSFWV